MAVHFNPIKGNVRPIRNRVLVTDMHFGEQVTKSGIIISNDDGTTRGVYPRWGKVYKKGPENTDEYAIGDWVLVEHGRWTRGLLLEDDEGEKEIRMVEAESILAYTDKKPNDITIGKEYEDGDSMTVRPEDFGAN